MEKDIKILEEKIEFWKKDPRIMIQEENFREIQAIENLIKGYKEKDTEINKLNEVIDMMAALILYYDGQSVIKLYKNKKEVKEKFFNIIEKAYDTSIKLIDQLLQGFSEKEPIGLMSSIDSKEEMERRKKELSKELENPKTRNRAERRAYARKNRKQYR